MRGKYDFYPDLDALDTGVMSNLLLNRLWLKIDSVNKQKKITQFCFLTTVSYHSNYSSSIVYLPSLLGVFLHVKRALQSKVGVTFRDDVMSDIPSGGVKTLHMNQHIINTIENLSTFKPNSYVEILLYRPTY